MQICFGGVATTLIKNSNIFGKFNKEFLVLEIDERSIQKVHEQLPAKNLCITNISTDQVQRNGDPDFIYRKINSIINNEMTVFLNNEEPRSKGLEQNAGRAIYYSVGNNAHTSTKVENFFNTTMPCPKCAAKIRFWNYNLSNMGKFKCTECDFKSQESPDVVIKDIDFDNNIITCDGIQYNVQYTLPYYIYNYALDIAVCKKLGIDELELKKAIESFVNPLHRREEIHYNGKEIKYFRMKQENPETLQNALDTIRLDKTVKAIFIGLFVIKDFPPAYTNTFYFFDCDLNEIVQSEVEKYVIFSKTVSYDTANRLVYAGVDKHKLVIMDVDDISKVMEQIKNIETNNIYIITGMKPYKEIKKYFQTTVAVSEE
ncbi:MAG: MurT ligase domain-containing protein [Oscillospiraceae bacterium]|nr:MurT ligase domain-containing protein [Oscillospiraceae bacterium]